MYFQKILPLGHRYLENLFKGPVEITEKIDGSMFRIWRNKDTEIFYGSKRTELHMKKDSETGIFAPALKHMEKIEHKIEPQKYIFTETLYRPKHNALAYDSIPKNHIAIWALYDGVSQQWLEYDELEKYADLLKIDTVPLLYEGIFEFDMNLLDKLLETKSYLGGPNVEGIVIKNYGQAILTQGIDLPMLAGKFVSEGFKEKHGFENTKNKNKWEEYCNQFCAEARWNKSIYRLRDENKLSYEYKDIGLILKEIHADIVAEHKEEISEWLWQRFNKELKRRATRGFPEYYKRLIASGELTKEK